MPGPPAYRADFSVRNHTLFGALGLRPAIAQHSTAERHAAPAPRARRAAGGGDRRRRGRLRLGHARRHGPRRDARPDRHLSEGRRREPLGADCGAGSCEACRAAVWSGYAPAATRPLSAGPDRSTSCSSTATTTTSPSSATGRTEPPRRGRRQGGVPRRAARRRVGRRQLRLGAGRGRAARGAAAGLVADRSRGLDGRVAARSMGRARVVLVRGHQANSWHLRPWRHLDRPLRRRRAAHEAQLVRHRVAGLAVRGGHRASRLPAGGPALVDLLVRVPGDRYVRPAAGAGRGGDRPQPGPRLLVLDAGRAAAAAPGLQARADVWETIPFLHAYRNVRTRPYRDLVLRETDLFLAAHRARAARCLVLEGAVRRAIAVCAPGRRPRSVPTHAAAAAWRASRRRPGRLVWEKGHQDLLRAVAALRRRGVVPAERSPRVLVIGAGRSSGDCAATRASWASRISSSSAPRFRTPRCRHLRPRVVRCGSAACRCGRGRSSSAWC